jgi:prepilin-type N-terminal cleavage/methylation domain-containing protein
MVAKPVTTRTRLAGDQGFTLVEFMIAALIMSFVLGGTVMLATQMQQAYSTQLDDAALEQEARYALDWIARDLRSAASDAYYEIDEDQEFVIDPNGGGDPDDSLQIQADINPPDGLIDDNGEDITIELDPLTRIITRYDAIADDTEEMTDGIFTDLQFTFLDSTRTVTANPQSVSYVQVQVTAESRAWNSNLGERPRSTFSTEVRLRTRR